MRARVTETKFTPFTIVISQFITSHSNKWVRYLTAMCPQTAVLQKKNNIKDVLRFTFTGFQNKCVARSRPLRQQAVVLMQLLSTGAPRIDTKSKFLVAALTDKYDAGYRSSHLILGKKEN